LKLARLICLKHLLKWAMRMKMKRLSYLMRVVSCKMEGQYKFNTVKCKFKSLWQ
jgi:hypothetical protein